MRRYVLQALLFSAAVVAGVVFGVPDADGAMQFYGEKIRASLFTGLLTTGSFLLSLKIFIVVKFKETVFDTPGYRELFAQLRKIDPRIRRYAQVRNVSNLIFASIVSALIGAAAQVTLGLLDVFACFLACVAIAAFAGAMLFQTLWLVHAIISDWLDRTEDL